MVWVVEEGETLNRGTRLLNPDGNERLTASVGLVLIVLTVIELATLLLGLHRFLSLHVFVGLVLLPPVALKLGSTGWRFTRYYTRAAAYRAKGAPQLVMRLLAPLLIAATIVLFASGVAMGFLHGHSLRLARQLHGPGSVAWMLLVGAHVLVYLKRALLSTKDDLDLTSRSTVRGASVRNVILAAAVMTGLAIGVGTLSVQHRWLHLPPKHDHRDGNARHPRTTESVDWSAAVACASVPECPLTKRVGVAVR
jgi:hypothetical protein